MNNIKVVNTVNNFFSSYKIFNILILIVYAFVLTFALCSKYYLFQSIISADNTSKKNIVTQKTINVVDTYRTELLKKDAAQKIEPILTTADDTYIKNNYLAFIKSIELGKLIGYISSDVSQAICNIMEDFNNNKSVISKY